MKCPSASDWDLLAMNLFEQDQADEMLAHARKFSESIRTDGMRRVIEGATTIDEIIRVTQEG